MIDSETLYQWELDATDESAELVKFDWSLDAAADRLLEPAP